jgi:hypothetical protein
MLTPNVSYNSPVELAQKPTSEELGASSIFLESETGLIAFLVASSMPIPSPRSIRK